MEKRQFLERSALIPGGNLILDGLYQKGSRDLAAVIAPPLAPEGGSMNSPVVAELVYALFQKGCHTLRFNFRGVEASTGVVSEEYGAGEEDFRAAMEFIIEATGVPWINAVGYSFGALIAHRVASQDNRVNKVVMVAPPIKVFDFKPLNSLSHPLLIIAGQNDPLCPPDQLKPLLESLGNSATLRIIPRADHSFTNGLSSLGKITGEFIIKGSKDSRVRGFK